MTALQWLLAYENFFFVFSLLFGMIFALGSLVGFGHSDSEADADADADADHDMDADHDHDVHHDAGHVAKGDIAGKPETDRGSNPMDTSPSQHLRSAFMRGLHLLGIGKVPLTVVLTTWCFTFGVAGMISNEILQPILKVGAVYGTISLAVATFIAIVLTGRFAVMLNRIMPSNESYAITRRHLVGCEGVLELTTSTAFGRANVRTLNGDLHTVSCRTAEGELGTGTRVRVTGFDSEANTYTVERIDDTASLSDQVGG
jgi:membrane protein implicated in regulation of membrane protease activity